MPVVVVEESEDNIAILVGIFHNFEKDEYH
jgi:hypothetical protein